MNLSPRAFLAVLLALFFASCVTTRDLQDIRDGIRDARDENARTMQRYEKGEATVEQTRAELERTREQLGAKVDGVVQRVQERTDAAIATVGGAAKEGVDLATTGGIAGIVTTVGAVALNAWRNRREQQLWGPPPQRGPAPIASWEPQRPLTAPPGFALVPIAGAPSTGPPGT